MSLNSESYSTSGVRFAYHNATVFGLSIVSGPTLGGTVITVHGSGFVSAAEVESECRFEHGAVVASFLDDTNLFVQSYS